MCSILTLLQTILKIIIMNKQEFKYYYSIFRRFMRNPGMYGNELDGDLIFVAAEDSDGEFAFWAFTPLANFFEKIWLNGRSVPESISDRLYRRKIRRRIQARLY